MAVDWMGSAEVWLLGMGRILIIALMVLIFLGIIVGFSWVYLNRKQYKKYRALIWRRHKTDTDKEIPVIVGWDKGAIIKDKKLKKWVFHLKKLNIDLGEEENARMDEDRDLDIPTIPYEGGGSVVFIEQLGPRKFGIGKPFIFKGNVEVLVSQADVAEAVRAYDMNAKYFGSDKMKWAGPLAFMVFAVLIIVLIAVLVNKFEVLKETMDIALKISQNNNAAGAIASGAPG